MFWWVVEAIRIFWIRFYVHPAEFSQIRRLGILCLLEAFVAEDLDAKIEECMAARQPKKTVTHVQSLSGLIYWVGEKCFFFFF